MNIKKHIPNLLTLSNLFCGCIIVAMLSYYDVYHQRFSIDNLSITIGVLFLLCLFFDLLDGLSARILKVNSEIGKQLDSLADLISFGLVPGCIMALLIGTEKLNLFIAFTGFLITIFSALRLAKFNIDTEQKYYFKGLPTPANAIFIFGIYFLYASNPVIMNKYGFLILLVSTFFSCFMLVANIPLFSFKIKSFKLKNILPQLILLVSAVVLFILMGLKALAPIILIYILLSIIFRKTFAHA